ncbi:MAG: cap protein, partial [Patescibacteria group bacterium]|nr:cap protein [Patescibacteria group bacterium]
MKKLSLVSLIVMTCIGLLSIFYFLKNDLQIPTSLNAEHIATPFPSPEPDTSSDTLTILFTGDTMLDRNIRLKAQQQGYDFLIGPRLKALLASADYSMTNLEGPVTNNPSISLGSAVGSSRNFIFTFDPQSLA